MNGARYITGWAEVRISGARPERVLTGLAERRIAFWDASPPKDFSLTAKVPVRAAKLIPPLAASLGCEGEVLGVHGVPALLKKVRGRLPLAALLLVMLAALVSSLSYVWDIEITGNGTIPEGVIRQALAECGVDIGAKWTGFSQDGIRNSMILRIPEIRWMTVTMEGCRAKVIVRERRAAIEPVDESEYVNIVSDKAGIVTAVYALNGTAETAAGKALLPGDVIIGGYATGRFGVQGATRAIGYAELRTWYEIAMEAPLAVEEKISSGDKTAGFALILGKLRINFYKGSSICPAGCDKIIERYELAREGVFCLPLAVEKTVITEYAAESRQAAELREELERMLSDELSDRLGGEGGILSQTFTVSESGGLLRVTLHAECLERAGTAVPLTEEELYLIDSKTTQTEDTDT